MFGYCKSDPDIPIEQLDYGYIETCKDVGKLQKILKILRSGEEGNYPKLVKFAEEQLATLNPRSPLLEKLNVEKNIKELAKEERDHIIENLQTLKSDHPVHCNGHASIPPIRNTKNIDIDSREVHKEQKPNQVNKNLNKKAAPRSYNEWSKIEKDIEKNENEGDLSKTTNEKSEVLRKNKENLKPPHQLLGDINMNGLSEQELSLRAENEKSKGNEAFRSADYNEALVYYNRSISLSPIIAVYNNRAMTYIHLKQYDDAINDCNVVINAQPDNIKAFLRRGLAYQSLNKLELALQDFTKVIETEPNNKRAKELYETVYKELEKLKDKQSATEARDMKKGKRLVIEEVENTDRNDTIENEQSAGIPPQKTQIDKLTSDISSLQTSDEQPVRTESQSSASIGTATVTTPAVPRALPNEVLEFKNNGNELYRSGQYTDAYQEYTSALHVILPDSSSFKAAIGSLFNNRAVCQLKIGNVKECIHDCNKALKYFPSIKSLLRRASAHEIIEKYSSAYVDYQAAYSIDPNPTTVQAMARLSSVLKREHGKEWREKLPKIDDIDWSISNPTKPIIPQHHVQNTITTTSETPLAPPATEATHQSTLNTTDTNNSEKDVASVNSPRVVAKTPEEKFKETKEKGNKYVQEKNYSQAIDLYTECIALKPQEVTCYTNRALCYLKLQQPEKAVEDCTKALDIQPDTVKALFRRAQAKKMTGELKNALADLASVLKIEPKNTAAKKELDECKDVFRKQLRELQSKNEATKQQTSTTNTTSKKSKKLKIEEINSENMSPQAKSKRSTKVDTCPMAKSNTPSSTSTTKLPSSKKLNSYEFMQLWTGIKSRKSADYADILKQVDASKLPELLSNKIDGEILSNFIHAIHDHFTSKEQYKCGVSLMKSMSRVQRFSTMLMFLGTPEKTLIKHTIELLESRVKQQGGERTMQAEINQIRSGFRCSS